MIGTLIGRMMTRKAFEAFNRRDLDAFLSGWTEDGVFHYPGNLSVSGEKRGKAAIRDFFEMFFRKFPEMKLHVKRVYMKDIFALGPSNSVAVEFDAEGTRDDGYKSTNSYVTLLTIKGGKVVEGREFVYDYDRFREAWGE